MADAAEDWQGNEWRLTKRARLLRSRQKDSSFTFWLTFVFFGAATGSWIALPAADALHSGLLGWWGAGLGLAVSLAGIAYFRLTVYRLTYGHVRGVMQQTGLLTIALSSEGAARLPHLHALAPAGQDPAAIFRRLELNPRAPGLHGQLDGLELNYAACADDLGMEPWPRLGAYWGAAAFGIALVAVAGEGLLRHCAPALLDRPVVLSLLQLLVYPSLGLLFALGWMRILALRQALAEGLEALVASSSAEAAARHANELTAARAADPVGWD
jgi:hypothetical protein